MLPPRVTYLEDTMTRKHFQAIADAIRETAATYPDSDAETFASVAV